MVLTDDNLHPRVDANHPSNYADYAQYYVPKSGLTEPVTKAHSILGPLEQVSQKCAYNVSAKCSSYASRTQCNRRPGCQWNVTNYHCEPKHCKCTVQSPVLSQCASNKDAYSCSIQPHPQQCYWDPEFDVCLPNVNLWHIALGCAAIIPVVYLLCYYLFNKADVRSVWAPYSLSLRVMHGCSVFAATFAFVFLLVTIAVTRKHIDDRWRYAYPVFMIAAGAVLVPVFRALCVVRGWSGYWVLLALMVTSAGTMWFIGDYAHRQQSTPDVVYQRRNPSKAGHLSPFSRSPPGTPDNTLNMIGILSAYYALFHVLVVDNLGWWWLFAAKHVPPM